MKQTVVLKKVEHPSMATAIRQHCLACSGGQQIEVRRCGITNCPLFPYRFGGKSTVSREPSRQVLYPKIHLT